MDLYTLRERIAPNPVEPPRDTCVTAEYSSKIRDIPLVNLPRSTLCAVRKALSQHRRVRRRQVSSCVEVQIGVWQVNHIQTLVLERKTQTKRGKRRGMHKSNEALITRNMRQRTSASDHLKTEVGKKKKVQPKEINVESNSVPLFHREIVVHRD